MGWNCITAALVTAELTGVCKSSSAKVEAELKEKTESYQQIPGGRLRQMEKMGTTLSLVRGGFPSAIQTDMQLERDRCGGPVVDLDGKFTGMTIARADRTRSFIIPTKAIAELLTRNPVTPEAAQAARPELAQAGRPPGQRIVPPPGGGQGLPQGQPQRVPVKPGQAEALRRHLEDMERLMERMRAEMEGIGE